MSLTVKQLVRELKKFPDNYKVALESYEEDDDCNGGYRIYKINSVIYDDECKKMVLLR